MKLATLMFLLLGSSNGVVSQDSFPETEEAEEGSGMEPETKVVADTYWSGTAPVCMGMCKGRHRELKKDPCGNSDCCWVGYKTLCRVNCGRPDVDVNGFVYGNDWWVDSVVRYVCRPGFILIGGPTRTCQSNGKWMAKPSCLRVCKQGRVELSERELDGSCTSSCATKSYEGEAKLGCRRIANCQKVESGWKQWFTRCDTCRCDCLVACATVERARTTGRTTLN